MRATWLGAVVVLGIAWLAWRYGARLPGWVFRGFLLSVLVATVAWLLATCHAHGSC